MNTHLEHNIVTVRQLIADYRAGKIVVPEFQREYVWKPSKAPMLIDSLYHGFPIASLLLWQSNEEVTARRKSPKISSSGTVSWLIDGQQRVTTLHRIMSGDHGLDVVFNPDVKPGEGSKFALANVATRNDPAWVRVADLWDDDMYIMTIRKHLPDTPRGIAREASYNRVRELLNYSIPYVRMIDYGFPEAVESFIRINKQGVKLKQGDIESAQIASKHTRFISDEVAPFLTRIHAQGFSRMNVMHLFRVCAFVAIPDGRTRTPLHELDRKTVFAAWDKTKRATEEAISIVRSEFGLVNMDILWSGALLVPVIALCATLRPAERDVREIAAWVATASLLHRYSKAVETALDQDLKACRASNPMGALFSNLRRDGKGSLAASDSDFGGALADRSGLFAMYVACQHRGMQDLYSKSKIVLQASVDRHHLLPRAQFDFKERPKADCIANIAFISSPTNKSVNSTGPEVYLERVPKAVLESQCIPSDPSLWRVAMSEAFWARRRELLAESFNDYLEKSLPARRI